MTIKPVGHRVLVKPIKVEEKYKGGIIVATAKDIDREQRAQTYGVVVAIGDQCWKDLGNRTVVVSDGNVKEIKKEGSPWCKVGDKVLYQKYSGMEISDQSGDYLDLIILADNDITAIIEEE